MSAEHQGGDAAEPPPPDILRSLEHQTFQNLGYEPEDDDVEGALKAGAASALLLGMHGPHATRASNIGNGALCPLQCFLCPERSGNFVRG